MTSSKKHWVAASPPRCYAEPLEPPETEGRLSGDARDLAPGRRRHATPLKPPETEGRQGAARDSIPKDATAATAPPPMPPPQTKGGQAGERRETAAATHTEARHWLDSFGPCLRTLGRTHTKARAQAKQRGRQRHRLRKGQH